MATAEVSVVECPEDTTIEDAVPVAVLGVGPDELTSRSGLSWHADEDELGPSRFTVAQAADGTAPFVLVAYEHDPTAGVTAIGNLDQAEAGELDKLLRSLHVRADEVVERFDKLPSEPASSLELVRDVDQARTAMEQQVGAITALAARLQRDVARKLVAGRIPHDNIPDWLPELLENEGFTDLTDREQEVVLLLLRGFSTSEVAAQLGIAPRTVARTLSRARIRLVGARGAP
jgi:DNA-binding NarL/FixJ family response regulator